MTDSTVDEVLAELAELEDPRMREVNARHGDDHGVNLTKLRGVAKRLKSDQELALRLWATDDTAARMLDLFRVRIHNQMTGGDDCTGKTGRRGPAPDTGQKRNACGESRKEMLADGAGNAAALINL